MNATKALELLKPIPAKDFIVNNFTDGVGKCCAIGHLVRLTSDDPTNYNLFNCWDMGNEVSTFARESCNEFLEKKYDITETRNLANVNNVNTINGYNQKNPKTRVINLLKDMAKAGY